MGVDLFMVTISFKRFVAMVTDILFQDKSKIVFTLEDGILESDERINSLSKSNLFSEFLRNNNSPTKDKLKTIRRALKTRFRYHLFPEQFNFKTNKQRDAEIKNIKSFMDKFQVFFSYFFGPLYYSFSIQDNDTIEIINLKKEYCCNEFNRMVDFFENNDSLEFDITYLNNNVIKIVVRTDNLLDNNIIKDFYFYETRDYQQKFYNHIDSFMNLSESQHLFIYSGALSRNINDAIDERIQYLANLLNNPLENKLENFNQLTWKFNYEEIYKEISSNIFFNRKSVSIPKIQYNFNCLNNWTIIFRNGKNDNEKIVNSEPYIFFMNELYEIIRYHDFIYTLCFQFSTLSEQYSDYTINCHEVNINPLDNQNLK